MDFSGFMYGLKPVPFTNFDLFRGSLEIYIDLKSLYVDTPQSPESEGHSIISNCTLVAS